MKIKSSLSIILTVLVVVACCGVSLAQEKSDTVPPRPNSIRIMPDRKITAEQIQELDQVNRLLRLGEYQSAADLLEMLIEKHPHRDDLKDRLASALERGKNFTKLLHVRGQRLEANPDDYRLRREYGHTHLLLGNADSAEYHFLKAIPLAEPLPEALYQIAAMYHRFGYYKKETAFIDSARSFFGNSRLLANWQGDALAAQKKFAQATDEYLIYMEKDSLSAKEAESKLIQLIRYPGSADTVMAVLHSKINNLKANNLRSGTGGNKNIGRGLIRTYGDLLIVQGRFDEAFALYRDLDSLNQRNGADIVFFVQSCVAYGKFENAITAGNYVIETYPQAVLSGHNYTLLGQAYQAVGQFDEAIACYHSHRAKFNRPVLVIEDNLKIGLIYKDNLKNYDSAGVYLNMAAEKGRNNRFGINALFGLADLAGRQHDFDLADTYYDQILTFEIPAAMAEQIEFEIARNFIFRLDFREAEKRFSQVIARYPRGLYINDAIEYSLILGEIGEVGQYDLYADAEFFRFIGQADSLEHYLWKICRVGLPGLAPASYLSLAEDYFDQEKIVPAQAVIDSLEINYPDSYYYPFARKLKADILFADEETIREGTQIYLELLSDYAMFPFAAEIREILRKAGREKGGNI